MKNRLHSELQLVEFAEVVHGPGDVEDEDRVCRQFGQSFGAEVVDEEASQNLMENGAENGVNYDVKMV